MYSRRVRLAETGVHPTSVTLAKARKMIGSLSTALQISKRKPGARSRRCSFHVPRADAMLPEPFILHEPRGSTPPDVRGACVEGSSHFRSRHSKKLEIKRERGRGAFIPKTCCTGSPLAHLRCAITGHKKVVDYQKTEEDRLRQGWR